VHGLCGSSNVTIQRLGIEISPMRRDDVLGKVAKRDYEPDELLDLKEVE
jgi:sialic acid synthase SpsE